VTPWYGYAVCRGVPKSNTVPVPAVPVSEAPRVNPYPCETLSVGYIVMDLLRWILIQCTTVRDDVAVLRRKLACVHYRERLIVKVCPFSVMFLYFVEIIKMDIDSMHNCYR
jgi:hypothetical protein